LWDQKAERDAIVICYNRYTRCSNALKGGDTPARTRSESRSEAPPPAAGSKWSGPGYLQELQRVNLDGQQVYSLEFYETDESRVEPPVFRKRKKLNHTSILSHGKVLVVELLSFSR